MSARGAPANLRTTTAWPSVGRWTVLILLLLSLRWVVTDATPLAAQEAVSAVAEDPVEGPPGDSLGGPFSYAGCYFSRAAGTTLSVPPN